jgi:signal transduction histidine kinase
MNRISRIFGLALLILAISPEAVISADGNKQVILLHSFGTEMRPWSDYSQGIREELRRQSPWPLDITDHSLISARHNSSNPDIPFVDYLTALFAAKPPDVIVSIGAPASNFVQRYRYRLFTSTPMVLTTLEQRRVQYGNLTQNDAVVPIEINYKAFIENILKVLPDTKNVAVVNGTSPNERFWSDAIRKEAMPLADRIELTFWDNLSFEDILREAARLPPHSAILWEGMNVDAAGVVHDGDEAFKRLHGVSNAPVFGYTEPLIGQGAVGGPFNAVHDTSRAAAAAVVRILAGEKAGDIRIPALPFSTPRFDWREMQRWRIGEDRLPPGSEIYFRDPTPWERYRWQIALVCAIILIQGGMISGLLFERRRRQHFQVEASRRSAELAHLNRYSTAGELTASIAHEINQPLGAILTNAETLQLMLKSPAPDLRQINEVVDDIHRDDKRASEVILRLRNMLKKAPSIVTSADLNDIVRDVVQMLSPYAAMRKCDLNSVNCSEPLPIKGDKIQIQQVLVNLIVNAADAMEDVPRADRTITISTTRDGNFGEASVSDVGPGIDPDQLKELFNPFFSTKPHGMGMGLSIARTIVEAHNGRIGAENKIGGGAAFRLRLPLSGR